MLLKGGVVLLQRGNWAWRLQACPSRSGPLAEAAPWAFTLPRRRGIPMHCEDASRLLCERASCGGGMCCNTAPPQQHIKQRRAAASRHLLHCSILAASTTLLTQVLERPSYRRCWWHEAQTSSDQPFDMQMSHVSHWDPQASQAAPFFLADIALQHSFQI